MSNPSRKQNSSSDVGKPDNQFLFQQYQVLSSDRVNHNELFWNIPNLFLVAQAFLFVMAIGGTVSAPWLRAVGAFISFVFGFISVQIFERNRISEISDAELMQDIEKNVLSQGYNGTEAHQKIANRKYLNGGNVEKNLQKKGFLKFINTGVSYELWKHGMWLVTVISFLLFLYNIFFYFVRRFPYLSITKVYTANDSFFKLRECLSHGSFYDFQNSLDKSAVGAIIILVFFTWLVQMLYRIYLTYHNKILFKKTDRKKNKHVFLYSLFEFSTILIFSCISMNNLIERHTPKCNIWLIAFLICFVPMFVSVIAISIITMIMIKKKEKTTAVKDAVEIKTVILAGGKSLRLQLNYPNINKFLNVFMGGQTLLETTINRNWKFVSRQAIVTTSEFSGQVANIFEKNKSLKLEQDSEKGGDGKNEEYYSKEKDAKSKKPVKKVIRLFTEPIPKGTATAIYYYLLKTFYKSPDNDPVVVILPSDHVIPDLDSYMESIQKACSLARDFPNMYLLGLRPSSDSSLYGHIIVDHSFASVLKAKEFKEKPRLSEIPSLNRKGMVLWNMGIFVARRSVFIDMFKVANWPNLEAFSSYTPSMQASELADLYTHLIDSSFDVDVLQKISLENLYVVPASFNWVDVGDPARLQVAVSDTLCYIKNSEDKNSSKGKNPGTATGAGTGTVTTAIVGATSSYNP